MKKLAKVIDDPTLVRDMNSNAILSKDRIALEARKKLKSDREYKIKLEETISDLSSRVSVLQELVKQLLEAKSG